MKFLLSVCQAHEDSRRRAGRLLSCPPSSSVQHSGDLWLSPRTDLYGTEPIARYMSRDLLGDSQFIDGTRCSLANGSINSLAFFSSQILPHARTDSSSSSFLHPLAIFTLTCFLPYNSVFSCISWDVTCFQESLK